MLRLMKRIAVLWSLLGCLFLATATSGRAETFLSAQDLKDTAQIEDALNAIRNLHADFIQIDDAGGVMNGTIDIQRPGKMRVTYAPPSKDFIIADGNFVHIWDDALQAQTNVDQESSLAHFILRAPVSLSGDVTVTKIDRFPQKIEITLVQTNDPGMGSLTLIFSKNPLELRQWRVVDPQGHVTGVSLEHKTEPDHFAPSTFVFIPPSFSKNR
ncbi:MAG: outer membrane lipoprotein carrier protein LolA [Alphaproteobacteria bacterium]|nr:outer membrane lipoprotein carrier protein LolA [Alphaproteobacteria bacterium]